MNKVVDIIRSRGWLLKSSLYLRGKIAVTGDFVTSIMYGYFISDDIVVPLDVLELVTADFRVADIDSVAAIFSVVLNL